MTAGHESRTMAEARAASAAAYAFIDAGPDGTEEWAYRRGDVAMAAAHALFVLLAEIDRNGRAAATAAGSVTLGASDVALVLAALDDAAQARLDAAESFCSDCETHPAGACESHVDDLDAAAAYKALAARLGGDR